MNVLQVKSHPHDGPSMHRYTDTSHLGLAAAGARVTRLAQVSVCWRIVETLGLSRFGKWASYIDKYVLGALRLRARARGFDVVFIVNHSDSPTLLLAGRNVASRTLVVVHDVVAIRAAKGGISGVAISRTGQALQRLVVAGLRRARWLISVSGATARELEELLSLGSVVVHNGLGDKLSGPRGREPQEYPSFVMVCSPGYRKNRERGMEIFSLLQRSSGFLDATLVVVGSALTDGELRVLTKANVLRRTRVVGNVSDEDLSRIYRASVAVIVPSLWEGFGWPIVEANAAGALAICLDLPYAREVAGDAGLFLPVEFEDEDVLSVAADLARMSYSERELKALANAARFSSAAITAAWGRALKLMSSNEDAFEGVA